MANWLQRQLRRSREMYAELSGWIRGAGVMEKPGGCRHDGAADYCALGDALSEQLETRRDVERELERAYRAVYALYNEYTCSPQYDPTKYAHICLTLGAAARFVLDGRLDGADYFVGKHIDVLHEALRTYSTRRRESDR